MPKSLKHKVFYGFTIAVALVPWLASMYAFYWLDSSGTWTSATAHRGKLSVVILTAGLAASFYTWTVLSRRYVK